MLSEVELRQLRCVIAVAEELHFTRAAEKLHITQSALTRQVRQLELQLGVDLFIRGTRHVEITDAGRAFIEDGRKALSLIERGVRRALGVGCGEMELLRVAYSPFVDIHFFSQLRALLFEDHPELRFDFVSAGVGQLVQGLIDGQFHLGVGILPVEEESFTAVKLFEEPMFAVLQKGHRLAKRRRVRFSDLGDDPVIWMSQQEQPAMHDQMLRWCRKDGYSPNVAQQVTSVSEILDFVAEGVGVGFVKASARRFQVDGLVFRPLGTIPHLVATGLVFRADNRSQALRSLIHRTHERFAGTSQH